MVTLTSASPAAAQPGKSGSNNAGAKAATKGSGPAKPTVNTAKVPVASPDSPVDTPDDVYLDGEKCQAKWKDGRFYAAVVKKFNPKDCKYTILYTEYGNTAAVPASSLRKLSPPPISAQQKKAMASAMAS